MKTTVKVEGLRELEKALGELPRATGKAVLRRVGRKRLQPIADHARQLAPVDEHDLQRSIAVSTRLSPRQRREARRGDKDDVTIHAGAGPLPQAHLQEFGTYKEPAQPFMRPAWDSGKDELLDGLKDDIWKEIEKTAARLARKAAKAKG